MKRYGSYLIISLSLHFVLFISAVHAQEYDGLTALSDFGIETYCSSDSRAQAEEMAALCDDVLSFYRTVIDYVPEVTLLVLSPEDWSQHTGFPFYGMPHVLEGQILVVASQNNDFWRSFIPPVDQLPDGLAEVVFQTYSDTNNNLTMQGFFNLLALHELGHAFHLQGGLAMQRKWMEELFANIFLHTYIAEQRPDLLPALTVFPNMVVATTDRGALKYSTLNELEANYALITQQYPQIYGWYQCRLHVAAGEIYDTRGVKAFQDLWNALKRNDKLLDDSSLAALLSEKVDQKVSDVMLKWDE